MQPEAALLQYRYELWRFSGESDTHNHDRVCRKRVCTEKSGFVLNSDHELLKKLLKKYTTTGRIIGFYPAGEASNPFNSVSLLGDRDSMLWRTQIGDRGNVNVCFLFINLMKSYQ